MGRERARRIEGGTGAGIVLFYVVHLPCSTMSVDTALVYISMDMGLSVSV